MTQGFLHVKVQNDETGDGFHVEIDSKMMSVDQAIESLTGAIVTIKHAKCPSVSDRTVIKRMKDVYKLRMKQKKKEAKKLDKVSPM